MGGQMEMDIPFARWHAAIPVRRSRRKFDSRELDPSALEHLRTMCQEFRPFTQARCELVTESPHRVFKGAIGPYGKIKGAPAFVAFVGDMDDPHVQEKVGYLGEGIILEATAMGLATCWVGGFFRRAVAASLVGIAANERVLAVTPVGHAADRLSLEEKVMTGFGRAHRRKPVSELVAGLDEGQWPQWMRSSLEAARMAPSAVNRQPWRFYLEPGSITVSAGSGRFDFAVSKRLDCGIAMLHIEVAALDSGARGDWEFLEPPGVARFTVSAAARGQSDCVC